MEWKEIEPPYRKDTREHIQLYFSGLYTIIGTQPNITIKGILYFNRVNSRDNKGHTIIYRSDEIAGKWTKDMTKIVEITDTILTHEAAIERCRLYCD